MINKPFSPRVLSTLAALSFLLAGVAHATIDVFNFYSDSERSRYQTLTEELRCPKCENENLANSNSQIAADMRRVIVEKLHSGASNQEIKSFMVDRYGDYVLYRPPMNHITAVLWAMPGILLTTGFLVFFFTVRKSARKPDKDEASESSGASE